MFLGMASIFLNPLVFYLMLFVCLTIFDFGSYVPDWCWPCGGNHDDDWRLAVVYTYPILPICAQWSELGKRWSSPTDFCLRFLPMDLTLVFDDFSEQSGADANTWALEERIRNLEFLDRQQEPQPYTDHEWQRDAKGGSSRGGPRRSSCQQTQSLNDAWLYSYLPAKTKYPLVR